MNNARIIIFAVLLGLISAGATRKEPPIEKHYAPNFDYQPPKEQLIDYAELQAARDWLKRETDSLRIVNQRKQDSINAKRLLAGIEN